MLSLNKKGRNQSCTNFAGAEIWFRSPKTNGVYKGSENTLAHVNEDTEVRRGLFLPVYLVAHSLVELYVLG